MQPATLAEANTNEITEGRAQILHYLKNAKRKSALAHARDIRVLLVDDDVESIIPIHLILAGMGCEITIAFDGQSAVNQLIKRPFDLVVLDWLMPDLKGMDVLRSAQTIISKDETMMNQVKKQHIPFVTYSSCAFKDVEIPNCASFDFVGHWQKPISLNKLSFLTSEIVSWISKR